MSYLFVDHKCWHHLCVGDCITCFLGVISVEIHPNRNCMGQGQLAIEIQLTPEVSGGYIQA